MTGVQTCALPIYTNTVVLGKKEELEKQEMWVEHPNWIKYAAINKETEVNTAIRYKDKGTPSTIKQEEGKVKVSFLQKVSAISPGQSAVFYEGKDVVGGGIIA